MRKLKILSLIVIYGASGAGKTTLADLLQNELSNTAHIGTDHIKRFISEFRIIESHNVISRKVINAMVIEYLENNINVIVEQGMRKEELEVLEKIAKDNGVTFFVYRLNISRETINERVTKRSLELGKSITPKERLDFFHKRHNENDYSQNTKILDSDKLSTKEMADLILKDLK